MDRYGLICRAVMEQPETTQRELAGQLGVSLGTANHLVKQCVSLGYIEEEEKGRWKLTEAGKTLLGCLLRGRGADHSSRIWLAVCTSHL